MWVKFVKFGINSEFEHLPRVRVGSISKQFPELLDDSKVAAAQLLNYTQVIELLSAPVEIKESVIERIENGDDVSSREIQRLKKEAVNN